MKILFPVIVLCLASLEGHAQSCRTNSTPPERRTTFVLGSLEDNSAAIFERFQATQSRTLENGSGTNTIGLLAASRNGDELSIPFSKRTLDREDMVARLRSYQDQYGLDGGQVAELAPLSGLLANPEQLTTPFAPKPGSLSAATDARLMDPDFFETSSFPPFRIEVPDTISQIIGDVDAGPVRDVSDTGGASDPIVDVEKSQTESEKRKRRELQAADAVVLISQRTALGPLRFCNGVHLGGGRILTNQHCIGSGDFQVWFGEIDWDKDTAKPRASSLACNADSDLGFMPLASGDPDAKRLDAAIITVPEREFVTYPRFANAFVSLPKSDLWCDAAGVCGPSAEPGKALTLIQIWSGRNSASHPSTPADGSKTISSEDNRSARGDEYPCYAQDTERSEKEFSTGTIDVCRSQVSNISSFGAPHTCDTAKGGSGAPVFLKEEYEAFIEGRTNSLILSGLHRSGKRRGGNCLIPAAVLKP